MTAEIRHPLSRIFVGPEKTIVICGSQIFTLNSQSGAVEASATVNSAEKNISSVVRIAAVDGLYQHLVTSGDDKRLRVRSVHDLKELSCREIPKRANVLKLSQDGQTILVADKFGDIFSYPLVPPESTPQPQPAENAGSKSIAVAMHDNPHGTLILGHASIITDFVLTHGEKQVVSADRDEHVRVSWYPDGWDVDRYCQGHKKFVSALEIPSCAPSILISGGGDPELYIWEYKTGKNIARIPVWDHIHPFIKVKGGRRKTEKPQGKKNKKKAAAESEDVEMATEDWFSHLTGPANEAHLGLYELLISLPKTAEFEDGAEDAPVPSDITSGPGLRASARQKVKEELEKRKALTEEAAQRAAKQPRVEET
ncbi:tRNA (guanine-N(7)-)-methyltransferase non-catalytic subunit trm82 [Ceratobasidium sp. 423]|nr:tRNA (guanine-N(7)-)-methyltransferase non-catalytic subunit trm82 [Ceratobasidium sp. 423]